jgi:hypothetical protein
MNFAILPQWWSAKYRLAQVKLLQGQLKTPRPKDVLV